MITVSNAKVAGFVPEWAAFRGFSVLFDSPGESLRRTDRAALLACDVDQDQALGLYRALRDALAALDVRLLTHTYLFCPLPPASYHVTAWDGANDGNLGSVIPQHRDGIAALLEGLPDTIGGEHPLLQAVRGSPLVGRRDWNLSFRFSHLALVGRSVLVAELAPATPGDAERLQEFLQARTGLSDFTQATFGVSPYRQYWPHVSLGYFANREHAQLALPCVAEWSALFARRLGEQRVTFAHASLYGFTNMATFFTA